MTDESLTGFQSGKDEGTGAKAAETGAAQAAGGETASFITKDQVDALVGSLKKDVDSLRQSVLDRDKNAANLTKRLQEQIDNLNAVSEQLKRLPADTPQSVKDRLFNEAMMVQEPGGEKTGRQDQDFETFKSQVNTQAQKILSDAGVTSEDPETAYINTETANPESYLESIKLVAARVKARKAAEAEQSIELGGNPSARMAGLGGGKLTAQGADALMQQYLKEVQTVAPGSEDVYRIRNKYREKGLDI